MMYVWEICQLLAFASGLWYTHWAISKCVAAVEQQHEYMKQYKVSINGSPTAYGQSVQRKFDVVKNRFEIHHRNIEELANAVNVMAAELDVVDKIREKPDVENRNAHNGDDG